jgi:outer membrane protein assembly factor BamB
MIPSTWRLWVVAVLTAVGAGVAAPGAAPGSEANWTQWGGPNRNFTAPSSGLARSWPDSGPVERWRRPLGDGYSTILVENQRLYTMYRRGDQDVVVALDAGTGKTIWEHAYDAPFSDDYWLQQGPGPRATPLIVGDRIFTVGGDTELRALDKSSGTLAWRHNLIADYGATLRVRGYSCSPIAYGDTVILFAGGDGQAIMAFDQATGEVAWKAVDDANGHASPLIVDVDGQDQLIAFLFGRIVGVSPADGRLFWSQPHTPEYGINASTPVYGPDDILFFSAAYGGGSRALRLARGAATELWYDNRMRVQFGTAIRVGDVVYGSSGDFGPIPFTAVDVHTGDILWRDRSVGKSSFVLADGMFVMVDEDGRLLLASPGDEGLNVHAEAQVLESIAWTAPTVVGTTAYLRDRKEIVALELGES